MPKQPQSANRLTERIHAAVRATVRAAGASRLLAACSGGPDSVCITHALAHVAAQEEWHVTVIHVEHNVRTNAHLDAERVRTFAAGLHLPYVHCLLDRAERTDEEYLRDARYGAIARVVAEINGEAVLTGHTENDQAETLLLHLFRGSGLDGLTAMRADVTRTTQTLDDKFALRILRPLLTVCRDETVAYCIAHGLQICNDPTNDDTRYTRNWVRHNLLPEIATRYPNIVGTLARNASTAQSDAGYLHMMTDMALQRSTVSSLTGATVLDAAIFRSEPPALQRRMLQWLMRQYGNAQRADAVDAALRLISNRRSTDLAYIGQMAICAAYESLIVGEVQAVRGAIAQEARRRHPLVAGAFDVVVGRNYRLARDDAPASSHDIFQLDFAHSLTGPHAESSNKAKYLCVPTDATFALRTRRTGDHFTPSNGKGRQLLRDYLRERRVPVIVRDTLPLLLVNDTIAWVIGYDASADFMATTETATHVATVTRIAANRDRRRR